MEPIPPAYVAWRAGTIPYSYSVPSPIDCLKIPSQFKTTFYTPAIMECRLSF
jgi:hypothetical protein